MLLYFVPQPIMIEPLPRPSPPVEMKMRFIIDELIILRAPALPLPVDGLLYWFEGAFHKTKNRFEKRFTNDPIRYVSRAPTAIETSVGQTFLD